MSDSKSPLFRLRALFSLAPRFSSPKLVRWLGLSLLLSGVGGYLAAVSFTTPLLQSLKSAAGSDFQWGDPLATTEPLSLPKLDRPVNILILGTKVLSSELEKPITTPGEPHALVNSLDGLSDTMLLLRLNPESGRVSVLSIPRDTLAWVEGMGETRINAANAIGGVTLSAKSVSDLLGGVPIDRYIRVNVQGIEKLVDALGGVTLYVPKPMKYRDDSQHLYINLEAGKQHLNGNQVLQFLRFRYDEWGDIGRVQRQQSLMRAMVEQSLSPATLQRLPQIFAVIRDHLDTNLSLVELMGLVNFIAQMQRSPQPGLQPSQVQMVMLPGNFNGDGIDAPSYWLPDQPRLQMVMSQYFDLPQPAELILPADPLAASVSIQDSTNQGSAIARLKRFLNQAGYQDVETGEPWSEPLQVTRIIAQKGDETSARALQAKLGFGEVRLESTGVLHSDITIQVGTDALQLLSTPNAASTSQVRSTADHF